jgi:hypothetical protein
MSGSHAPVKPPRAAAHRISMVEAVVFASGLLAAMLVGIAASGVLPA